MPARSHVPSLIAALALLPVATAQMVWRQLRPGANPGYRYGHAMAYDSARQRVVLTCGQPSGLTFDTWEFDGATWTLRQTPSSPPPRNRHHLVYDTARRVVVLFGGADPGGAMFRDTWEYDGVTWRRRTPATTPTTDGGSQLAYDAARGVVVMFGGTVQRQPQVWLDETWEWNGLDWRRRLLPRSPPRRADHSLGFDAARGVVVLHGGRDGTRVWKTDTWEWDGGNAGWVQRASDGPDSMFGRMVYDVRRQQTMLLGDLRRTSLSVWDGRTWRTEGPEEPSAPPAQVLFDVVYDTVRERIVYYGGINYARSTVLDETWTYSPTVRHDLTAVGRGCAGSAGDPVLSAEGGVPILGNQRFGLRLRSARANAPALLGFSVRPANFPFGGCTFYIDTQAPPVLVPVTTGPGGALSLPLPLPTSPTGLRGVDLSIQGFVSDPQGRFFGQLAFTNGLRMRIGD